MLAEQVFNNADEPEETTHWHSVHLQNIVTCSTFFITLIWLYFDEVRGSFTAFKDYLSQEITLENTIFLHEGQAQARVKKENLII